LAFVLTQIVSFIPTRLQLLFFLNSILVYIRCRLFNVFHTPCNRLYGI